MSAFPASELASKMQSMEEVKKASKARKAPMSGAARAVAKVGRKASSRGSKGVAKATSKDAPKAGKQVSRKSSKEPIAYNKTRSRRSGVVYYNCSGCEMRSRDKAKVLGHRCRGYIKSKVATKSQVAPVVKGGAAARASSLPKAGTAPRLTPLPNGGTVPRVGIMPNVTPVQKVVAPKMSVAQETACILGRVSAMTTVRGVTWTARGCEYDTPSLLAALRDQDAHLHAQVCDDASLHRRSLAYLHGTVWG